MESKDLKRIASQLKKPKGTKGIEMGEIMSQTNANMIAHSIEHLKIQDDQVVLELGHGNGSHLDDLLRKKKITYHGIEISTAMNKVARTINKSFVKNKQAVFCLYDGINLPYPDLFFDRIFTVNTIYFWSDSKFLLLELFRVLKPHGILTITFVQENYMKQLSYAQFGFEFYDNQKIEKLIKQSRFKIVGHETQTENVKSKLGNFENRVFTTYSLTKTSVASPQTKK